MASFLCLEFNRRMGKRMRLRVTLLSAVAACLVLSGCGTSGFVPWQMTSFAYLEDVISPFTVAVRTAPHARTQSLVHSQATTTSVQPFAGLSLTLQSGNFDLYLYNAETGVSEKLNSVSADFANVQLSPDGTKLVLSAYDTTTNCDGGGCPQIYVFSVNTQRSLISYQQITSSEDGGYFVDASISPDGSLVGFDDDDGNIYVLASDGSQTVQPLSLSNANFYAELPVILPDNQTVLFSGQASGSNYMIYSVGITGGTATALTTGGTHGDYMPTVSADGTRMAFARDDSGYSNIWQMELPSGTPQQLTAATDYLNAEPLYFNGKLLYIANPAGDYNFNVYQMNYDGTDSEQLTTATTLAMFNAWWGD